MENIYSCGPKKNDCDPDKLQELMLFKNLTCFNKTMTENQKKFRNRREFLGKILFDLFLKHLKTIK